MLRRPAVLKLLFIALLAETGYAVMNLSTMQPYLRDDRHFGTGTIGLVIVAYLLSEALFKSPMGHISDRIGPKKLMLIGPSISVFTALISLIVPRTGGSFMEVLTFVGLRSLDGLGAAMIWPAAYTAVSNAVEDCERQEVMSFLNLCYMVGIAIAFGFGGAANDLTHTKWAGMILAAAMFLGVAISVWRFVPEIDPSEVKHDRPEETGFSDFKQSLKQIPTYLLLSLVTFAGIGFPFAIFKFFLADQFQLSESMIGAFILPSALAMAGASVPMSKFGERIGRANAVHLGLLLSSGGMWLIALGAFFPPPAPRLDMRDWRNSVGDWLSAHDSRLDGKRERHQSPTTRGKLGCGNDRPRAWRYHRRADRLLHVRKAPARRPGPFLRSLLPFPRLRRLHHRRLHPEPPHPSRSEVVSPQTSWGNRL